MLKWIHDEPNAVKFKGANFTYTAPKEMENCADLPCYRGKGIAVSCWKFSLFDRVRFILTGRIWLTLLMDGHPPVALTAAKSPFVEAK